MEIELLKPSNLKLSELKAGDVCVLANTTEVFIVGQYLNQYRNITNLMDGKTEGYPNETRVIHIKGKFVQTA